MPVLAEPLTSPKSPADDTSTAFERFERVDGRVLREVIDPAGIHLSSLADKANPTLDDVAAFDQSWLRSDVKPSNEDPRGTIRCADLFCGVGGLSVGLEDAAWGLGFEVEHVLAMDTDPVLLQRYAANFETAHSSSEPIEHLIDGEFGMPATHAELALADLVGDLDFVLAGPPCQGHSDLNNHTRRDDPRNALFLRVIRFAEICRPRNLMIENVPAVQRDKGGVVERACEQLEQLGYVVDAYVAGADTVGVAQRRRRFFLVASLDAVPSIEAALVRKKRSVRPVMWAIEDLHGEGATPFDSPATHSDENRRRIAYLFENDLYDLPDSERPACHRDKPHSYRAVYGRMISDEPAPTITVGFGSTGQGRFVHPIEQRTLTPHEAARIQSFPDWFDFETLRRGQLQKAIGNAVPPLLASAIASDLLLEVIAS